MTFLAALKSVGKDLSHVEGWIKDGVALAAPIIGEVDPPLGPIIGVVEKALGALPSGTKLDAKTMQSLVTSAAATQGTICTCNPCACCPNQKPATWQT
jgi:hypothetical protein